MIKVDPPRPEVPPQDTIVDMVRTAAWRFARQEALVCGDQRLDWAAFDARINRVANDLLAHGVSKGDTIAILSKRVDPTGTKNLVWRQDRKSVV